MNTATSLGPDFLRVVAETLTDQSVVFNVTYDTLDNDTIVFGCENERAAEALAEQLRACSFVQTILAEDKVADRDEEAL